MDNAVSTILIVVVILVIVFLILREVNCWYWKINDRISLQHEQISILKKILKELKNESYSQENQTREKVIKEKNKVNISKNSSSDTTSSSSSDTTSKYKAPPYKIEKVSQNATSNEKYLIVFDDNEKGYIYLSLRNKQAYFKGKPEGYWVNVKCMYNDVNSCITALHYFLKTNKELPDGFIEKY